MGLGSGLLLLGYAAISIIPNLFYRKGYQQQEMKRLIIVAHRGGAALSPENTLAAIERAITEQADMIEIDIHQTADNQIVVCHDESIDRTTDGSGLIRNLTLEEIRRHSIVDAQGNVTDLKIPTLDEVMDLVNGRTKLLIEIKRTDDIYIGIEQQLVDAIRAHNAQGWVTAQSFNDSVLDNLHEIDPSLRLEKLWICKLAGLPVGIDGGFDNFDIDRYPHVSSFNFYYRSVTDALIQKLHAHGKEVKIWTVKGPEDTPRLNVDGIITDNPDLWR